MTPSGAEYIRQVKQQIDEVDPGDVHANINNGVAIVDVRETNEWDQGHLPGAAHVPRGHLESRIEGAVPDRSQRVILYCASGNRSALAAKTLRDELGYEHVESMTGGYTLWKDRGYDVEVPRALTAEQRERPAAWARRPRCTWPRPASARSASSTTTSSTSPTSSARSSTRPTASACPRSTRPRRR